MYISIYIYFYLSIYLSLSLYIYIYIYIYNIHTIKGVGQGEPLPHRGAALEGGALRGLGAQGRQQVHQGGVGIKLILLLIV